MPRRLFIFIQLEFPWALGPADGRYLLRRREDEEPERVVVVGTLGATRADAARRAQQGAGPSLLTRLSARGPGPAAQPQPEPAKVSTTRVTVIDPVSLSAENQAKAWLEDLDRERDVHAAVEVVNRILHLHRIAAADPYVHEVSPAQAIVIRAGWGEGEQVASGRWLHARELNWRPSTRSARRGGSRTRTAALRPQERLASLLGARSATLLCEELTLRARLDLDHGRPRHATVQLERALVAAVAELTAEGRQDLALRIDELSTLHGGVGAQAAAVLTDAAAVPDEELVTHALERLEAALRARTAGGVSLK